MGLSTNPQPGDWYGIVDRSSDHDTLTYCVVQWATKGYFADSASNAILQHCNISNNDSTNIYFSYTNDNLLIVDSCSIHHAPIGIEMRNGAEVTVSHSNISNHTSIGIYNYKGDLSLANSLISNNGAYGLYGYMATDSISNSKFVDNDLYGIKIYSINVTNDSSYFLYDTISCPSSFPSQSGIFVEYNDKVRIENCKIRSYDMSAIRLNNSDASITDCDLTFNTNYGIDCFASSPKVRDCLFDSLSIGVKNVMVGNGISDLGRDIEDEHGNNSFLYCSSLFIHFSGLTQSHQIYTLYAQQNWWGDSTGPEDSMLYVDNRRLKVIEWDPPLSEQPSAKLASQLPLEFSLKQNYPNPFNPVTTISFALEKPAKTIVTIYNILGQRVATPVNEILGAGSHGIIWDGKSSSGSSVASGIYFYTIQSGEHFDSKKMLLLR